MDYRDPFFWLKRRAVKAFLDNLGPIAVVVLFLVAFMALGYIEVTI